jgi:cytidylate kinase
MSIITISRGSYSHGKEIAEQVAAKLNYACIGREALLDASEKFNIPEIKLFKAIHDAPSILERFTYGKEKYVSYIQAALLEKAQKDNIVYHGMAGHFFLKGIAHVLKIRIISDFEDRVTHEMERMNISREDAYRQLKKDDEERMKWSSFLYGIDTRDSSLYDLVIHIKALTIRDAVDIICDIARRKQFQTTPDSQKAINDLVIAASVKAALVFLIPDVNVQCADGKVIVFFKSRKDHEENLIAKIHEIAWPIKEINEISVEIEPVRPTY